MRCVRGSSWWLWCFAAALLAWQLQVSSILAQPAQQGEIEELKKRLEQLEQGPEGSVFELLKGIQISGFIDTTANYNFNEPKGPRTNRLRVFDVPANTFSVNLVEVALEKKAVEPGTAGFRVDFDAGRDVRFFELDPMFAGGIFTIEQAFVTYKAPLGEGLTVTFGRFVTLLGAEVIEAPDNFNISRSFLFGFAVPFTHTGLLFNYPFNSVVDLTVGVVNGWDNIDDNNDSKTFIGRLAFNVAESFMFAVAGIYGAEQTNRESPKRWVLDLMSMIMPLPGLHLVLNYDLGREDEASAVVPLDDAMWQGIALMVRYEFTKQFSLSARGELFADEDGARTGTEQDLWEITLTAAYKWVKGFETRLEYRHDHSNVQSFNRDGRPTKNQDTVATEFLFRF